MIDSITRRLSPAPPAEHDDEIVRDEVTKPPLAERVANRASEWVGDHPLICVSMGIALGAALGWFVKRK